MKLLPVLTLSLGLAAAVTVPLVGFISQPQGTLLHARMAESGGWTPENLKAATGQPLHLRLTSDDVTHGFAIGQMAMQPVDVRPGEVSEITITFNKPGKYTYYCTRWCGPNHWRMRGTIEVSGVTVAKGSPDPKPLYITQGIDLDQPHPAAVLPQGKPSASWAEASGATIPEKYLDLETYRTHSPAETWQALRDEQSLKDYSDQQLWDMVAKIASLSTSSQALKEGQQLYAANCAACHGESGKGDGVMAEALAKGAMPVSTDQGNGLQDPTNSGVSGHNTQRPANFADALSAFGASPALLQGKILRGGMGTGMPYWGPIFTDEQTWALVAYIQSFQLEMETQKP